MNRKIELPLVGLLASAFSLYILLRAWWVPVTVDESSTSINHVPRMVFDTLFYEKEANPNNHILNTLAIKLLTGLFGWLPFVIRAPALVGGFLYLGAAIMLTRRLSDQPALRIFGLVLLLGNPYTIEFFSLARGYGLAAGLMLTAVWQAWRFLETRNKAHLTTAVVLAGLSVYANFTLLLFFLPFVALLFYAAWQMNPSPLRFWKETKGAWTGLGIYAALWYLPLARLNQDAAFNAWTKNDTFFFTVQRTVGAAVQRNQLETTETVRLLAWLVALFCTGMTLVTLRRWWRAGRQWTSDPRLLLATILPAVVILNILQAELTGVTYLESRLAQFYYPLLALQLTIAGVWMWQRWAARAWAYLAPLGVFTLLNFFSQANLREAVEWWFDQDTYNVMNYLRKKYEEEGRKEPFLLDTFFLLQNSYTYHLELDPRDFNKYVKLTPWHTPRPPLPEADFFFTEDGAEAKLLLNDFDVVMRGPNSNTVLLRKKRQALN